MGKKAELLAEIRKANAMLEGGDPVNKAAAIAGQVEIADKLTKNDEETEVASLKAQLAELRGQMKENRKRSKAAKVGSVQPEFSAPKNRLRFEGGLRPHKALRDSIRGYKAGEIVGGLADRIGLGYDLKFDPTIVGRGKASLESFMSYGDTPMESKARLTGSVVDGEFKATLGATGATGGYVLPNNLVDSVIKPATQKAVYQQLVTVVNGVSVRGVDMPYRTSAAQRATFIDWGALKTNVNEAYGSTYGPWVQ